MSLKRRVEAVVEELDGGMGRLYESIGGIPLRQGSFRNQHDNFARAVAEVLVVLETTLSRIPSK